MHVCIKVTNTHKKHFTCGLKNVIQLVEHMPGRAATASETSGLEPWLSGLLMTQNYPQAFIFYKDRMIGLRTPAATVSDLICPVITPRTALLRDRVAETPINLLGGLAFPTNMEDFNSATEAGAVRNS